jgi:hypothetical protein
MASVRLSYANVTATLALFIALGGGAYAAVNLPANSVGTTQLKGKSVTPAKLAASTSALIKGGPAGPAGAKGAAGGDGAVGAAGAVGAVGPQGPKGDTGPGGGAVGPAGGDLTGTYPGPAIAPNAVTGAKVNNDSLTGADITESTLVMPGAAAFTDAGLLGNSPLCSGTDRWENWSPGVQNPVGYYRDPLGFVHLQGYAHRCGTVSDTIFTLPAGYRPTTYYDLVGVSVASGNAVFIEVDATGAVKAKVAAVPSNTGVGIDSLTFRCAPTGANGCP